LRKGKGSRKKQALSWRGGNLNLQTPGKNGGKIPTKKTTWTPYARETNRRIERKNGRGNEFPQKEKISREKLKRKEKKKICQKKQPNGGKPEKRASKIQKVKKGRLQNNPGSKKNKH